MPRRPRVAVVGWKLGSDRFAFTVVSMLLAERVRPLVDWRPMPLLRVSSFRLEWLVFYLLGAARVARLDVDVLHTIGPTPVIPNHVDLNTVTFCHAAYHEPASAEGISGTAIGWQVGEPIARLLERWWFERRVRVLGALSAGGADDLRRHYPAAEVVVVPRGLDLERFAPNGRARGELRDELGVGHDELVALFVDQEARPLKGLTLALEGAAEARRDGRSCDRLWIVGAGNERYAPRAQELGLDGVASFLGRRADVERFYQAADVFVLPTAFETFSRSAHEAAACGLPIVAPRVGGVAELIGDDAAGVLVERSGADVARALRLLAADGELRERLGAEARARASAFGIDASARRILDVYDSLYRRSA